uniref:ABC-type xenobiotic transporter n=1 Tax=Daphnia magna TaxID=35525 RepID=A0A482DIB6_9CRUS|nr:ATP-binding cassette sub-family C member 7 [Daphnia magna]
MDWNIVCGSPSLVLWANGNIGKCFGQLALTLPSSVILTAVSSYYLGKEYNWVIRDQLQINILSLRASICLFLAFIPFSNLIVKCYFHESLFLADYMVSFVTTFSWLCHMLYIMILKQRVSRSLRGPLSSLAAWMLTVIPCAFQLRGDFNEFDAKTLQNPEFWLDISYASLQFFYLLTLIPYGMADVTGFDRAFQSLADENLNQRRLLHYNRFDIDFDRFYLGIAREGVTFLSRLFLSWVQPLMKKGSRKQLNSPDDLFDLPRKTTSQLVAPQFERQMNETQSVVRSLRNCFGSSFYLVGLLKFTGDALGFVGPLVLSALVQFIDNKTEPMLFGYLCAAALCLASFTAALCNVHFNFKVSEIALRMRIALISTIYNKTLRVSSADLSKFSSGDIVNMMSIDTDRIINFCPSFHAFWSLPLQIGVTLYLLYAQVGLAFLAGLSFAVLLIPVNRWIAVKVGKYSGEMMTAKDKRVRLLNELLTGIRVVKFYAWEKHFRRRIEQLRAEELKALKARKYLDALCVYFWATTPVLVAILTFATFVLMGGTLTSAKVFTCMALFNMLISPLNAFPWVIGGLVEAWVSLKRVRKLIQLPNMDSGSYYSSKRVEPDAQATLIMEQAEFSWQLGNDGFRLSDLNLMITKGQFIGVIGKVGSGKSSFLQAITGNLVKRNGSIYVRNWQQGVAIVTQEPWIQRGTIRDNILFGKPYDAGKYRVVLEVCALNADLRMLTEGDQTEIGDNGVTLSGGQKARIALARAVYQDKGFYLMDDVLSAVDSQVARHLVDSLLVDYLRNKTRILCTHHAQFLQSADWILVFEDGQLISQGPPSKILTSSLDGSNPTGRQVKSTCPELDEREAVIPLEEDRCTGQVEFDVISTYWKAVGMYVSPIILAMLLFMQSTRNVSDWWLAHWVSELQNETINGTLIVGGGDDYDPTFYLAVYGGIAAANTIFTFFRAFLFAYGGLKAATFLHSRLVDVVLQAKMIFFDTTPVGRILNRLSSDVYAIDESLPFVLNIFLAQIFGLLGTIIVTCVGIPWISLLLLPLGFIYFNLQHFYRHTSRELKRLSTVTLSPIYSRFAETLSGLVTIRATDNSTARFAQENLDMVEDNVKTQFASQAAANWLGLRLQLIGVAMVTGVGIFAVVQHHLHTVDPGLVGLAISYALSITGVLSGVVTSFVETEKEMVSVERVHAYIQRLPAEPSTSSRVALPMSWPSQGCITFQRVSMRYREHFPLAVKDINFEIRPSEKVGIVGRTGSGKTTLFQILFRLSEICSGEVQIDGVNIQSLSLFDLRSRLAIIPQDPFIFSGTIRENLDPTSQHTDRQLWKCLERCHLKETISRWATGLSTDVQERGKLFSVGQKQLLCLARALLLNSKVICIDEATASVDAETDRLIQKTIRSAFRHSTVLTIAHRLETIMDSDQVAVMSAGQLIEFDSPSKLLENPVSHFSQLVNG